MSKTSKLKRLAPVRVQPDGSVTAYDAWWKQADRKWIRRSPYSHKWKLWGQMPILALRTGWMACEAWYRLKRKSPNS